MDCKDKLFNDVLLKIGADLTKEQIDKLKVVLAEELHNYDVVEKEKRDLLSVYSSHNERLIQSFIMAKKIEGLSDRTLKAYLYTLRRFTGMFDVNLLQVDTNMVRMFLYRLESLGNSETTLNNNRLDLNSFYSWLVEEEYIPRNPIKRIKPIKGELKVRKPYSDTEVTKIKDNCKTFKQKAVMDLLLTTGIRNSELCSIKLSDVDFYDKSIVIHGKGNKQRIVYLSDGCLLHISQYLEDRKSKGIESEYLICNDRKKLIDGQYKYTGLSNECLRKIVKQVGESANVENNYPHKFRRTFACTMLDYSDIATVQTLMGHACITTTQIYVEVNEKRARYEHSKLRMAS